ncbi:hypothetical protein [Lysobacter humi (ex Lee et al. 2017)]
MLLFFALCSIGVAIAGLTALVIFWPLALVHIRDRHPALASELGENAFFRGSAWMWLLRGDYRETPDRGLSGLATPARVSLLTMLGGLVAAWLLWVADYWMG